MSGCLVPAAPASSWKRSNRSADASEGVADSTAGQEFADQIGELLHPATLPRAFVADVPLTALAALELLQVRPPQQIFTLGVPAEIHVVQPLVVGQKDHLGCQLP